MPAKRKPEPIRKRLTIPGVNRSVLTWFELQDDASASVRHLIQESIQRDGYIDVINRPVEQQPRRGRPPAESTQPPAGPTLGQLTDSGLDPEQAAEVMKIYTAGDHDHESVSEQQQTAAESGANLAPAEHDETDHEPQTTAEQQADEPATTNETPAEPELDDIFGSMRD